MTRIGLRPLLYVCHPRPVNAYPITQGIYVSATDDLSPEAWAGPSAPSDAGRGIGSCLHRDRTPRGPGGWSTADRPHSSVPAAEPPRRLREIREEVFGEEGVPLLAEALHLPAIIWRSYEAAANIPGAVLLRFIEISEARL